MRALALAAAALAQALAATAPAGPTPAPVEVVGPPSPALWLATRGAGELWILPAPPALPRGLRWNRLRLEGVLAGARVLITPSAYRLERTGRASSPQSVGLAGRLPPSLRARFDAAVAELGEDPTRSDGLAPLDAAYRLRDDAWRTAGLDTDQPDDAVRTLARLAGASVRPAATYRIKLEAAAPALSDRQQAGCVEAAIDDAAWGRQHAADAARAWALGDVRAWLAQSQPAGVARCLDAAPAFAALRGRNLDDLTRAALAALALGGRSVLLTSPDVLLRTGGLLERLRAAGAAVQAPGAADR